MADFDRLRARLKKLIAGGGESGAILQRVATLLRREVPHYDWVGFYLVVAGRRLELGPYDGEPTEHTSIQFGSGICGQAAEREETFVVQDVSRETNYLSCSAKVKSEIVVPVFKAGRIVGELDIDSHQLEAFTAEDRAFLEELCRELGLLF